MLQLVFSHLTFLDHYHHLIRGWYFYSVIKNLEFQLTRILQFSFSVIFLYCFPVYFLYIQYHSLACMSCWPVKLATIYSTIIFLLLALWDGCCVGDVIWSSTFQFHVGRKYDSLFLLLNFPASESLLSLFAIIRRVLKKKRSVAGKSQIFHIAQAMIPPRRALQLWHAVPGVQVAPPRAAMASLDTSHTGADWGRAISCWQVTIRSCHEAEHLEECLKLWFLQNMKSMSISAAIFWLWINTGSSK